MFVYYGLEDLVARHSTAGSPSDGTPPVKVDHIGSTRMLTTASGVTERHECHPLGDVLIPTAGVWRLTNGFTEFARSGANRQMFAGGCGGVLPNPIRAPP